MPAAKPLNGPSANLVRTAPGGLGVLDGQGIARVGADEALEFDFTPATVMGINSVIFETGTAAGSLDLYVDTVFKENIAWSTGGFTLVPHAFTSMPTGPSLNSEATPTALGSRNSRSTQSQNHLSVYSLASAS